MSDLHGENEAFVHILNSASGVIREKVDIVLGDSVPEQTRAELATLIYYPNEKLPQLKQRCADEEALAEAISHELPRPKSPKEVLEELDREREERRKQAEADAAAGEEE